MLFELCFQILTELLSENNLLDNDDLLENDDRLVKKSFLRVCHMCLPHVCYNLFLYCVFYGAWFLDGCVDYIICTTN